MVAGIMTTGSEHLVGAEWMEAQKPAIRSYKKDVIERLEALPDHVLLGTYGTLCYGDDEYDLHYAIVGEDKRKPTVLITAGVHGYEEGGVLGALAFLERFAYGYAAQYNFVVVPCVSPWAYEYDRRLTGDKKNPNRNFVDGSGVPESELLMALVRQLDTRFLMTIDLHETTWTDPVILQQEGNTDIDIDDIHPVAYLLETAPEQDRLGVSMMTALEEAGFPVHKEPMLFGEPADHGVIYDLDKKIASLSMSFMLAASDTHHAPTGQAFTTEPFVDEKLFYAKDGLQRRADAQIVQICAALEGALGRPMPKPAGLTRK